MSAAELKNIKFQVRIVADYEDHVQADGIILTNKMNGNRVLIETQDEDDAATLYYKALSRSKPTGSIICQRLIKGERSVSFTAVALELGGYDTELTTAISTKLTEDKSVSDARKATNYVGVKIPVNLMLLHAHRTDGNYRITLSGPNLDEVELYATDQPNMIKFALDDTHE